MKAAKPVLNRKERQGQTHTYTSTIHLWEWEVRPARSIKKNKNVKRIKMGN